MYILSSDPTTWYVNLHSAQLSIWITSNHQNELAHDNMISIATPCSCASACPWLTHSIAWCSQNQKKLLPSQMEDPPQMEDPHFQKKIFRAGSSVREWRVGPKVPCPPHGKGRCVWEHSMTPTHHSQMQAPTRYFFVENRGLAFGRKTKKCMEHLLVLS